MLKYFVENLKLINRLFEPVKSKCEECEFTETCEIQNSNYCGKEEEEDNK